MRVESDLYNLETLLLDFFLGKEAAEQYAQGDVAKKFLTPILPALHALSEVYNQTDQKGAIALETRHAIQAYALYFLPINYYKLRMMLKLVSSSLTPAAKILDFGCGPGTASLAAVDAFGHGIELHLYDLSNEVLQMAEKLLAIRSPGTKVATHSPVNSNHWKAGFYDLVIAANSLNEVRDADLGHTLRSLLASLNAGGTLLILEPALRAKTRRAMHIRDRLLELDKDLCPVFPCTHRNACPMLTRSADDWCHGFLSWQESPLLRQIDQLSGFNKHRLKYSAFVLQKNAALKEGLRVVGVGSKNKTGFSTYVCSDKHFGLIRLAARNRREGNRSIQKSKIFDLLKIQPETEGSEIAASASVSVSSEISD